MRTLTSCLIVLFLDGWVLSAAPAAGKPVDFQREIRPILSDACFHCHGPDKNTRLAGLRLDTKEGAFASGANGSVIVPGKPLESRLYQRITHEKPGLRMPPLSSHKKLTEAQKDLVKRWIEQGAEWKEHWSFAPPVRPAVPAAPKGWARNPIDQFLLAKIAAAGLKPAPEADRRTLARRLSLDLTGLPPDPAEVDAFVRDQAPDAYEKLVEKWLSSPHWGEHRGRYWLDAARYADTHGIHVDNYREMWPYRDWVIAAFNRNMPFDQFTIEQIAGDMLPNRRLDQQIASGFNRCNITTNEGGSIPEEVEAVYMKDRVDTTSTVFLGLTMGCATCHDHKFDPFSQKDFYQMVAFFKNTTQRAMDGNIPDTPPIVLVPRADDVERYGRVRQQDAALRADKARIVEAAAPAFAAWLDRGEFRSIRDGVDARQPLHRMPELAADLPPREGPFPGTTAIEFLDKKSVAIPGTSAFDPRKPFTFASWVFLSPNEDDVTVVSQLDSKTGSRGWALDVSNRQPRLMVVDAALPEHRVQVRGSNVARLKPGAWSHIVATYDGSGEAAGLRMFVNGKQLVVERQAPDPEEVLKPHDEKRIALRFGGDGRKYFRGGALFDARFYDALLTADDAAILAQFDKLRPALAGGAFNDSQKDTLRLLFLNRNHPDYLAVNAKLEQVEYELRDIRRRGAITHVMQEKPDGEPKANILFRGMYDAPRDEVRPDVPAALPPMSKDLPRNRLGLAKWLVDPGNPLLARVTVNRFWQEVFGTGLVRTAEDFGSQGEPPANQQLLDWLAVEFRESGWDVKKLFRLMLTSSAYRQSAAASPEKLKKDPENRLLARGPRFRLDGELVRDYALSVSGLLKPVIGGPSVKPYQPDNIWETVAMKGSNTRFYRQDHGDALYRRSMYTFWKRSAPPSSMEIFNAPSRENCAVRRERTNTPLQALVTMNDVQFVEAARSLAERSMREASSLDKRIDVMGWRVLARPFDNQERKVVKASFRDFLQHYDSNPSEAEKLIGMGESKAAPEWNRAELAAWTMLANQLLNLDEALNK